VQVDAVEAERHHQAGEQHRDTQDKMQCRRNQPGRAAGGYREDHRHRHGEPVRERHRDDRGAEGECPANRQVEVVADPEHQVDAHEDGDKREAGHQGVEHGLRHAASCPAAARALTSAHRPG